MFPASVSFPIQPARGKSDTSVPRDPAAPQPTFSFIPNALKIFVINKTEFITPADASFPAAELTRASLRFVAAVAALIGLSLLLASL